MTLENLKKANELKADIDACNRLLEAFEWEVHDACGSDTVTKISRNPVLMIRSDDADGGYEEYHIPGVLQQDMIAKVRNYAEEIRKEAKDELARL